MSSLCKGYSCATLRLNLSQYSWRASLSSRSILSAASSFFVAMSRAQSCRILTSQLSRFALNRAPNSVPCFIVHCQVVLLTTMLLDLRHDFLLAISADLPIAGLRSHVGAPKIHLALSLWFTLKRIHYFSPYISW
jgi:hypothetical protein